MNRLFSERAPLPTKAKTPAPRRSGMSEHAKRKFAMTPGQMAETYVWLAADPALQAVTGGYWDAPNVPAKANNNAYNKETWKKLWDVTETLAKVAVQ